MSGDPSSQGPEGREDGVDPRRLVLQGSNSREVLKRIWDGDPLAIGEICAERVRERALLLDVTRATSYAQARIAWDSFLYDAEVSIDHWLRAEVDHAIDELLAEDRSLDRRGIPVQPESRSHYQFLCEALELPPMLGRKACVVFNSLPDPQRHTLWAVLVDERSFEEHAAETATTPARVRKYFEDAALLMMTLGVGRDTTLGDETGGAS